MSTESPFSTIGDTITAATARALAADWGPVAADHRVEASPVAIVEAGHSGVGRKLSAALAAAIGAIAFLVGREIGAAAGLLQASRR